VKRNGDRIITLADIADIRLTFEDRRGTARFNGEETVALQVVKRKGANAIDTVALVREVMAAEMAKWPEDLRQAVEVNFSLDNSREVNNMVNQLLASVLTAIALVMIVVLASLGMRSSLMVGFAIPTSFLLTFAILSVMGIPISNIVMFGLILAVGMLVDGAIVVVEYADKKITEGIGPMTAYGMAAKRMFWPIVSSTATTLCAFLPFLFWPGVAGQFMSKLPVTIIIVLSASLLVALIYLPVVGGMAGRVAAGMDRIAGFFRAHFHFLIRFVLLIGAMGLAYQSVLIVLRGQMGLGGLGFSLGAMLISIFMGSLKRPKRDKVEKAGYRRSLFGRFINFIAGNPIMPLVSLALVGFFVATVFTVFQENSKGFEFFVTTEPERAVAYVQARGNLSIIEKDRLVKQAEAAIAAVEGVDYVFAFAGAGGLNTNTGGAVKPIDTIGEIQIELGPWNERRKGKIIIAELNERLSEIPGVRAQIIEQNMGPASSKAINLQISGDNWEELLSATAYINDHFSTLPELVDVDDTRPLPGIDWQLDVDVEEAGRFGTDVVSVGGMVQLVTRGLTIGTMRTDSSDDEIDIRVRFPEDDRLLSTL
ncbi:MAG TPA: efflux RND transporter permease subunit, partial [Rhodobacteraceae bacterium]|nr:efflux RND transporter permease subunit [Paracoccaceae bacterium]